MALTAAPTILAARPVVTVTHPTAPIPYPAGEACAFDIRAQPTNTTVVTTTFSNGTVVAAITSDPRLTNLATGASIVTHSRFVKVETFDAATNSVTDVVVGRFNANFFPGDQGPYGVVSAPGLFLSFVGEVKATSDADSGAVTRFSLHGRVTANICAELST